MQDTVSRFLEAFCDRFHKNEKQDCIRSFGSKARPFLKQIKHTKAERICAYIGQCPDDPRQSPLFDVDAVTWNVTSDSGERENLKKKIFQYRMHTNDRLYYIN